MCSTPSQKWLQAGVVHIGGIYREAMCSISSQTDIHAGYAADGVLQEFLGRDTERHRLPALRRTFASAVAAVLRRAGRRCHMIP